MNFKLSLEEEIEIYLKTNLTPTELFIVRLLFLAINGDKNLLVNYINNSNIELREVLQSLQDKKIINSNYIIPQKGEILNLNIPFNKNFLKNYVKDTHALGKEFFEKYPMFININGKMCSIKNITKGNFYTLDDFFNYYAKTIKLNGVEHEYILDILDFGIQHNLIHYSILEFLASQKWNELEFIRSSGEVNGYNNTELL